ncbi:DUF4062 domain-containing protein [Antarctobacter sp.]|uniref:DUF4062 domain-containing protein n=1 Tax=Antarctobacter sp. TaxID=1872577 RepID=UPI003A908E9A
MVHSVQLIRVFISSPGDLDVERQVAVDVLEELNSIRGLKEGFLLRPLMWERDVRPEFGNEPQALINRQIGEDYDIFVGIICSRFGTPTSGFGSGTEEEFEIARNLHENGKPLEILFYFKDFRSAKEVPDVSHLVKIDEFKRRAGKEGVYCEFKNSDEFRSRISSHLSSAVNALRSRHENESVAAQKIDIDTHERGFEEQEDVGLLELIDGIEDNFSELVEKSAILADAIQILGVKIEGYANELKDIKEKTLGSPNRKVIKRILLKTSTGMREYNGVLEDALPSFEANFSTAIELMGRAIIIQGEDGFSNRNEIDDLFEELKNLKAVLETVRDEMANFDKSVKDVPRLDTGVNQAKRAINRAHQRLDDWFDSSVRQIDVVMTAMSNQGA